MHSIPAIVAALCDARERIQCTMVLCYPHVPDQKSSRLLLPACITVQGGWD